MTGQAHYIFKQNDGDATRRYYEQMNMLGWHGQLAVALFRAQKRSAAAKSYRGGRFRRAAYDVKNWSLGEICRVLESADFTRIADIGSLIWGWKRDADTPGFEWVLYVDLPQGQVSFHSAERLSGPDYPFDWDGKHESCERILAFCCACEVQR